MDILITKLHSVQDAKWAKLIAQYSFCLAVFLEIVIVIWDKSQFVNPIEGRLFQVTFAFCLIKVTLTKYDFKEYITIFLCCLLGLAIDYFGGRNEILRMFMFVAACKDVDMRKCLKNVFWLTLIGCAIIVLLSITGIYGDITVLKRYQQGDHIDEGYDAIRYCFGMGNANSFHIMISVISILGLYLFNEKTHWWIYASLFVLNGVSFYLTRCKTGFIIMSFAIFLFAIEKMASKALLRLFDRVFLAISVFFVVFSIWLSTLAEAVRDLYFVNYTHREEKWLYRLDRLLTGRILCLAENEKYEGAFRSWTLFTRLGHEKYIDLGYVRLFFWYGIIPTTIILSIFLLLMIYLRRNDMHYEIALLFIIAGFTVVEAHFVSVYIGRCYPLFILGAFWPSLLSLRKGKDEQQLVQSISETE